MGRHEASQPSLSQKVGRYADLAFDKTPLTRPRIPKLKRHFFRPLWGFLFSVSFVLVTVVDPYSGTIASASTMMTFDFETEVDVTQTYGYSSTQKILFTRGGFNIVTGSDAAAMFVDLDEVWRRPIFLLGKALGARIKLASKRSKQEFWCLWNSAISPG